MMQSLVGLFSRTGLPPHGFCLLWNPDLIWLHAVSDTLIGIAYLLIPSALAYLTWRRRQDIAFGWMFWLFAIFILSCGTTHFMEVWVLWNPDYGVQGLIKAATALASLLTAVLLWRVMPQLATAPTSRQYRHVSSQLVAETKRHRDTVARLRHSEQIFRLLVEGVSDYAVFLIDTGGWVTSWNAGAQRFKGYTADEIIGRHFSCFYTPQDQAAGLPQRVLHAARTFGRYEAEGWRVRKDGTQFWAHVVMDAVYDDSGELFGFAKITRDITERRRAEQDLETARAALAHAQKMEAVGHLTGGIAHDFNNLLTALLGSLELLERKSQPSSEQARRLMGVIRHAGERGAELTRRLLAFARKQTLEPVFTNTNDLIQDLSDVLQRTLGETMLIETRLEAELWPVRVDRGQLESALLNLTVNARDAMVDGGTLIVATGNIWLDDDYARQNEEVQPGPYAMIAITDTGHGMAPDVVEHAFEPFYTTKPIGHGTGLGLSQVYGFVKQSGGHISLHSEPGAGTTVKLFLPRHSAAAPEPSNRNESADSKRHDQP